jgi:hypothetical protein
MKNRRLFPPPNNRRIPMKTILLFGYAGAVIFCAIAAPFPWSVRLLLGAAAVLALLHELSRRAPVGYQDDNGFHLATAPEARREGRQNALGGALSPAKA